MSDEKDIIPSKYKRKSKVTIDDLVRYLEDHEVTPEEALEYVITASRIDPTHPRTEWKLFRFTLYLWERDREFKKGQMGKKKDTCLKVVNSKKFKDIYKAYSFNPRAINEAKEADVRDLFSKKGSTNTSELSNKCTRSILIKLDNAQESLQYC